MFEQENGSENAYLVSIHNLFINLCWQVKSTDTFGHLLFGECLKLESVWDHTGNMNFNVFYSTFTNVFLFLSRFLRCLTFFFKF